MRNLALEMGLLSGTTTYTRFIILGRSRIGSNFLRSLLNDHPHVEAYGEIFRNQEAMDWDHVGQLQTERMHRELLSNPVEFVNHRVFRRYPKETAAVGFKIFYYHARDPNWLTIWPYLQAETDIHVIHMKRRNILRTHLSRKRAEITDNWVNTSGQKESAPTVTLDYEECLADFQRTRAYEEEYDRFFSAHPLYELIYEELAADQAAKMQGVQEFLQLPIHPVQPGIYKQSHKPLSQAITNYHELKKKFTGSPWESFFCD